MRVGSLFSGIGGFDLGLERAGMEIIWQCEIDPFCNKVLAKHWPNVKRYGDIKELNGSELEPVDLICGGFPCQPYSCAGKRMGAEDDRALWPEMLRVIQEVKPRWVIGENVAGFINMGLDQSISDLEREGYTVQAFIIPACSVNAPHRRDRVWIVAYDGRERAECESANDENEGRISASRTQHSGSNCHAADTTNTRIEGLRRERQNAVFQDADQYVSDTQGVGLQGRIIPLRNQGTQSNDEQLHGCCRDWIEPWIEVAARLCRVDDGLPRIVDRVARLKALGNAVVPQIVEIIGRAIMEIENSHEVR